MQVLLLPNLYEYWMSPLVLTTFGMYIVPTICCNHVILVGSPKQDVVVMSILAVK